MINNRILIISSMYFNGIDFNVINNTFIDGIELRVSDIVYNDDLKKLDYLIEKFKKYNIKVYSIHAPFEKNDISSLSQYNRKRSIRDIEKAILIADKFNAKYIVCHASSKFNDKNIKERFENLKYSLEELRETANFYNKEILIENVFSNKIVNSIEHIERIIQYGFNICFDTGHAILSNIKFDSITEHIKKHIKILHIHSNNHKRDQHKMLSLKDKEIIDFIKSFDNNTIFNLEIENDLSINKVMKIMESI